MDTTQAQKRPEKNGRVSLIESYYDYAVDGSIVTEEWENVIDYKWLRLRTLQRG